MNIAFVSNKEPMEIIRSFDEYQLLRNEDILNLDI